MDNRNKNKRVGLHHSKKLFIANQMTSRVERQFMKWENMFVNHLSSKESTSPKYIRSSYNSIEKKMTQSKNGLRSWIDIFPKKTYIWPTGIWKSLNHQFSPVTQSCSTVCDPMHTRLPCPSPTPGACSNSCSSSQWCHPTISSYAIPFSSCLQSFPASRSFPISQFFTSGGQSFRISASPSVLHMNIQDWFPLGWTGWISL